MCTRNEMFYNIFFQEEYSNTTIVYYNLQINFQYLTKVFEKNEGQMFLFNLNFV